jgi:hypothetical protein
MLGAFIQQLNQPDHITGTGLAVRRKAAERIRSRVYLKARRLVRVERAQ